MKMEIMDAFNHLNPDCNCILIKPDAEWCNITLFNDLEAILIIITV